MKKERIKNGTLLTKYVLMFGSTWLQMADYPDDLLAAAAVAGRHIERWIYVTTKDGHHLVNKTLYES